MTFGEVLDGRMEELGMSATELSAKSGVGKPYISQLINGKLKDPTWPKACALIDAVGLTTDEFRQRIEYYVMEVPRD